MRCPAWSGVCRYGRASSAANGPMCVANVPPGGTLASALGPVNTRIVEVTEGGVMRGLTCEACQAR
jgi:hypothetical protein